MAWKPDYVTVDEMAAYVQIPDLEDNTQLRLAITTSSRAIDRYTHRQFGQVASPEERRYTARWNRRRGCWVASVADLQDVAGLTVTIGGATVTTTLEPVNAPDEGRPFERLVIDAASASKVTGADNEVVVTAKWGWTAIPDPVKQATLLQGSRLHWRRNAPAGVAGSPDAGSEIRLLARLDPDLCTSLHDFVRDRALVAA